MENRNCQKLNKKDWAMNIYGSFNVPVTGLHFLLFSRGNFNACINLSDI